MKTKQTKYTGAFGATEVVLTPETRRTLEVDVKNCPHCGNHHVNARVRIEGDRFAVRCAATGGRPIEIIMKLFLNVP
jgi:ribosomal protein L37AE/L43A